VRPALLLLEQIGNQETTPTTIRLQPRLVTGDSTRAPSKKQRWPTAGPVTARRSTRRARAAHEAS
jgi:hypothetical protein